MKPVHRARVSAPLQSRVTVTRAEAAPVYHAATMAWSLVNGKSAWRSNQELRSSANKSKFQTTLATRNRAAGNRLRAANSV
jgi:hypothetical protein